MSKYTDKFKAGAVITLQAAGYPDNPHKIQEVAQSLKINRRTLLRWYQGEVGAPADKTVQQEKRDMEADLRKLFFKLIDHALDDEVIVEMSGQQAVTSMGIVFDKIRLLMGLPTHVISVLPDVVNALERAGEDPETVFKRMIKVANERVRIE